MHLVRIAAGLAVMLGTAAPGLTSSPRNNDPNRQICRSKAQVGSRLQRVRECHTAAEWADLKYAEQLGLQSKQFNGDQAQGFNEYKVRGGFDPPK